MSFGAHLFHRKLFGWKKVSRGCNRTGTVVSRWPRVPLGLAGDPQRLRHQQLLPGMVGAALRSLLLLPATEDIKNLTNALN